MIGSGLDLAYADGRVQLYRHPDPLPRAYLVATWRLVPAGDPTLPRALLDPALDLRRAAVVEQPCELPAPAGGSAGSAAIVREASSEVIVRASAPETNLLVLADSQAPGWRAYVDGQRTAVCQTNYLYRGVPLGPGTHEVRFSYRPASFGLGLALAGGAALGAAVLLVWERRRVGRYDVPQAAGWALLALQAAPFAWIALAGVLPTSVTR